MKMLLTVREVASHLRTNKAYVYGLINRGELAAVHVGSLKVRLETLERFVKERER